MNGVNKVILVGNIGQIQDARYTQQGMAIVSFSLAVNSSRKVQDQWQDETEWINCTAFDKTANYINDNLGKGVHVFIEGKMKTNTYEKNGQKMYSTKVIVHRIQRMSKKEDGQQQPQRNQRPPQKQKIDDYNIGDLGSPDLDAPLSPGD